MGFDLPEWFQRRKFQSDLDRVRHAATRQHVVVNPYHAVGVKPGKDCCGAAQALRGKRFLSSEAPRVPLRECTAHTCGCTYQHFDDRRSGIDRRRATAHPAGERRRSRGRRVDDQ
jgi:hypothetical protein